MSNAGRTCILMRVGRAGLITRRTCMFNAGRT